MVLLDQNFNAVEIYEAERPAVATVLGAINYFADMKTSQSKHELVQVD
jgi:hypothetical protein